MNKEVLAKKIVEKRKELHYSQLELSKLAKMSERQLIRIEQAKCAPRPDTIELLAKALKVTPEYLTEDLFTINDLTFSLAIIISVYCIGIELLILGNGIIPRIVGIAFSVASLLLSFSLGYTLKTIKKVCKSKINELVLGYMGIAIFIMFSPLFKWLISAIILLIIGYVSIGFMIVGLCKEIYSSRQLFIKIFNRISQKKELKCRN